jgi:hypothetical protein
MTPIPVCTVVSPSLVRLHPLVVLLPLLHCQLPCPEAAQHCSFLPPLAANQAKPGRKRSRSDQCAGPVPAVAPLYVVVMTLAYLLENCSSLFCLYLCSVCDSLSKISLWIRAWTGVP